MDDGKITIISDADLDSMEDRTREDAPEGESLGPNFWKGAKLPTWTA